MGNAICSDEAIIKTDLDLDNDDFTRETFQTFDDIKEEPSDDDGELLLSQKWDKKTENNEDLDIKHDIKTEYPNPSNKHSEDANVQCYFCDLVLEHSQIEPHIS